MLKRLLTCAMAPFRAAACVFALFAIAAPEGHAQDRRPIKVGAITATGMGVSFTESALAAKAYFDQINAQGGIRGRSIQYTVVEEGGDLESAASAARRLIDDPDVVALIGGSAILDCQANAKHYEAADLYSFQGTSASTACFTSTHIVPLNVGPYFGLANAVSFASDNLSASSVCVAALELPGFAAAYQRVVSHLRSTYQRSIAHLQMVSLGANFDGEVRTLKERGCDAVIFVGPEMAVMGWLQSAITAGLDRINWIFLAPGYSDGVLKLMSSHEGWVYAMAEFEPWQSSSLEMLNWKREMRRQRVPLSSLAQGGHVAAQVFVRLLRQMNEPVTRSSFGRQIAGSPRLSHPFLGMPLELGPGAPLVPNRASIAMTIRQGGWRIASAKWTIAPPDLLQPNDGGALPTLQRELKR